MRVAQFNVSLGRDGPGLLLRDILRGDDQQIAEVAAIIARVNPDILVLNDFDYDLRGVALAAFADVLSAHGADYPYRQALAPNSVITSDLDLDGDGRFGGPGDRQGYGDFAGAEGMAVLSRLPLEVALNLSDILWQDLPGATLPEVDGRPFPSAAALALQRLSSKGHYVLRADNGFHPLYLLLSHPTPPVFDSDANENGLRNADEIRLWTLFLDGALASGLSEGARFVIAGDMNADPFDGEGGQEAIRELLAHQLVQDPAPASEGGAAASVRQGGGNLDQVGPSGLDTVDWDEGRTPGNMRVDYVIPSANLEVTGAGVFWPAPEEADAALVGEGRGVGSHHRLVYVDLVLDRGAQRLANR